MKRALIAFAISLLPSAAFAACNPTPMGDFNNASSNFKTALDGSSNCFGFVGLVDGTGANALPSVAALADATANPTDALLGSLNFGYNGTTWDRLRTVGTGILKTDFSTLGGTAPVTGGVAGLQAVGGPVASGGSNADNPLKVGGVFNTTQPTVTNGQIVDSQYTARGAAIVATGADAFTTASTQSGTWTVQPGNTANSTPWLTSSAQSGTWTVQPGNTPNTTPWLVQNVSQATGGMSVKSFIVANNTTSFVVDASPGTLYGISGYSISNTTPVFIKTYNTAQGSVTCGTPTPFDRPGIIPANQTQGSGLTWSLPGGVAYSTAITACVTGGIADNDTTAPAASTYLVSFYYK